MAWHFQRTKVQSSLCRRTFNAPAALAAALALTLTTQRRFSTAPRPHQPATLATATPTGALEGHQRRTSPTRAGATGPYTRSCVALLTRSKVPRTRKHDRGRNALLRHLALRVKSVLLRRGELIDARARPIRARARAASLAVAVAAASAAALALAAQRARPSSRRPMPPQVPPPHATRVALCATTRALQRARRPPRAATWPRLRARAHGGGRRRRSTRARTRIRLRGGGDRARACTGAPYKRERGGVHACRK